MTDLVTETSPSARFRRYLKVPGRTRVEPDYYIPYWRLEGQGPGPTLLVLGGVHGNEFEGPLALYELLQELPEKEFVGTVIVVPWTNLPAVEACRRETPLDGKNLARCFPGSPEGTFTERLAYSVGQELIRGADFLLDLHSAGDAYTSPPLVGYYRAPGERGSGRRRPRGASACRSCGSTRPSRPGGRCRWPRNGASRRCTPRRRAASGCGPRTWPPTSGAFIA